MAYLIQDRQFINENIFKFEQRLDSQYNRFLNKNPSFVTYYNISGNEAEIISFLQSIGLGGCSTSGNEIECSDQYFEYEYEYETTRPGIELEAERDNVPVSKEYELEADESPLSSTNPSCSGACP